MEDSAPLDLFALHSLSDLCRETALCDPYQIRLGCLDAVKSRPEQPQNHETQRRRLRKRLQRYFYFIESKLQRDELFYKTLCRAVSPRSSPRAPCDLSDERPHETQRARRLPWVVDDSHWLGQEVPPHEPCIQQIRVVIADLDPINHNHETTTKSVLPNRRGWEYVCTYDTMATGGTQQKPAIGSYLCSPVNQHSKCNNYYSQSLRISGNRKDEDPWKGNQEEDKEPNGGTTVITIRDEDRKSDHSYKSSFAFAQFSTLAISSFLLCLMVLFPNFAQKNQAITAAALMGATLGSLVSLETILKCPNLARTCGYFAVISLLVAIGSILSTSANWVTI